MTAPELFKNLDKLREEIPKILSKRTSLSSKAKSISKAYQKVEDRSALPEELCVLALDRSKETLPLFYEVIIETLTLGIIKTETVGNFSQLLGNLMYLKNGNGSAVEALSEDDKKIVLELADKIKLLTN